MNKTQTKTGRCNLFSTIWAAMYGCTGAGTFAGYVPVSFGRKSSEYACPVCRAVQDKQRKMNARDRQAEMLRIEAENGVENYRYARAAWVNGRPVVVR